MKKCIGPNVSLSTDLIEMPAYQLIKHFRLNRGLLYLIVLLGTIVSDQTSKFWARRLLEASKEISFTHNILKFSLIENHGGFLGVVNSFPENIRFYLLTFGVAFLLLVCLFYLFIFTKKDFRYDLPLVFVSGGGMSNLLDRILHNGGVTDFLSIGVNNLRTGIFNLADMYILIGSFVLGFMLISSPQNTTETQR